MSMLNKLKESQKNPVFMDDDDIDNMDFPLPGSSNDAMPDLQSMMRNMSVNTPPPPPSAASAAAAAAAGPAVVVMTPQGVRRLDPSEYKNWVCVYPCYIDADKSVSEGRKVIKKYAVSKPNAYHMALATQRLGLSVVYEGKRHPRDWATVGRIKVQMKNNNFFIHSHITTRKQLYIEIAKRLPEVVDTPMPENMVTPMTSLAEIEAVIDKQRKAQGLPTLAEMREQQQQKTPNLSKRKQKVKYVRG